MKFGKVVAISEVLIPNNWWVKLKSVRSRVGEEKKYRLLKGVKSARGFQSIDVELCTQTWPVFS